MEQQWENVANVKWDRKVIQSKDLIRFWNLVSTYEDAGEQNLFNGLVKFTIKVLCLPLSNGKVCEWLNNIISSIFFHNLIVRYFENI